MKSAFNKQELYEILLGGLIFIISLISAFIFHWDRFYFFLLLGMFLILKGLYTKFNKKNFLNKKSFLYVYLAFIFLGFFGDLIIGRLISELWSYPTYSLLNNVLLYIFIYPLGGLVMVYFFSLVESIFIKKSKKANKAIRTAKIISIIFLLTGVLGFLITLIFVDNFKGFFMILFLGGFEIGLVSLLSLKFNSYNLFVKIATKPFQYVTLILLVSYIQGIIQEYPNLFAKEWIYTNFPFQGITFIGIPIMVLFVGWILLLVGPYLMYNLILVMIKNKLI